MLLGMFTLCRTASPFSGDFTDFFGGADTLLLAGNSDMDDDELTNLFIFLFILLYEIHLYILYVSMYVRTCIYIYIYIYA